MANYWLGASYHQPANRTLILGESWDGDPEPFAVYIPKWAAGHVKDAA